MAFRVVLIESECSIHLKLNNLLINKGEGDLWIPLDDISIIVLDNLKIEVTVRLLSTLAEHNIGVVFCDMEHLPIGFYCSYDNHSRVSKCIKFQIDKPQDFYDSFWRVIIQQKIINQKDVLEIINKTSVVEKLEELSNEVESGDLSNREAHAAKVYFNSLMDTSFSRGNEDILLNSGLDYGYTIIRSYIARACVGYGLNSQIGIHHKNEYNRFNLVDDLMEPIRPFVDLYAYRILENEKYFKVEHRRKLINLLNHKVLYDNKKMFIANMIEEYIAQYASFIAKKRENVVFPKVIDYIGEEDD
ncbi:MAG: type II CRISPR-associated endonuclease Cas1 [Pseudobutyrivibrio sp.]|nr:type II CRISPR-associated endonuclease Cas1 [Pseudobutyrivibrio sp.]